MTRRRIPQTLEEISQAKREAAKRSARFDQVWNLLGAVLGIVVVTMIVGWLELRFQSLDIKDGGRVFVTPWRSAPEVYRASIDTDTVFIGKLTVLGSRTPCAVTFVVSHGNDAAPIGGALGGLFGTVDLHKMRVVLTAPHTLTVTLPNGYQPTSPSVQARLGDEPWSAIYNVASN